MNDFITRQDVLDVLRNLAFDHIFQCGEYYGEDERQLTIINARKAIDVIEAMPSVEQERKKGHWVPVTNGRGGFECDQCHNYTPSYQNGDEYLSYYCPNCGAEMRMRGKE